MTAHILTRFLCSSAGNIAPIFAIATLPLVVAMGAAVDYTNAYDQQTIVQDAMDSAALAAGKKVGLVTQAQLEQDVESYYSSNVSARLAVPPPLQVALGTTTITLTTDLSVPTYFLGLIGLNEFTFHLTSEATLAVSMLEVAMVLDNSGSMSTDNNIATLRTAATNLTNTLYGLGTMSTKPEPIKVALVPFAASVNVGPGYQTDALATWLDKTGIGTYNLDVMDGATATNNPFTLLAGLKNAAGNAVTWGGCMEARPIPNDTNDEVATITTAATMYVPMFAPDEPDNWTCTTGTCANAGTTSGTRRYNGAPAGAMSFNNYLPDVADPKNSGVTVTATIASPGVFTVTALHRLVVGDQVVFATAGALPTGVTAGTTYFVKTVPTTTTFTVAATSGGTVINTSGTQSGIHHLTTSAMWTCSNGTASCNGTGNGVSEVAAMQSVAKYGTASNKATVSTMTVGGIPGGPNFMCTTTALTPLTTTQATVTTAVSNMLALGATNIHEGLMWGWRALSPGAPFTEGRDYTVNENQKILILMTDGYNTYYPQSKYVGSWYGAWGYIYKNHLGTTSTNQATEIAKMNERTAIACTNVKATGIRIYTVAFTAIVDTATKAMLAACATDSSMAFTATDQAALISTFQAIGDQLTVLRISH